MEMGKRSRRPLLAVAIATVSLGGFGTVSAGEKPAAKLPLDESFELTEAQRARLAKFLPHALDRLDQREPMHMVALGDSVTRFISHDEHDGDTHLAYEGVFAKELAKLFFYTGGVRDIKPAKGQPAKPDESAGPEITVENMGLGGRVSMHALARTTTDGFANRPSIMTIEYGINDSYGAIPLHEYLQAYEDSAALAPANGCDVIFLGPSTILGRGSELHSLARTLYYSSALRDLAAKLGVFYFDLATVTTMGSSVDPKASDEEVIAAYNAELAKEYHTHSTGEIDTLHPSPQGQRAMGLAVYEALLKEPVPKYRIGGFATLDGKGGFDLEFKVKNLSEDDVDGRVILPPFRGFKPTQSAVPFQLRAGKGQVLNANYKSEGGGTNYKIESSEPVLRVPLIIADEERCVATTVVTAIGPVAPVWRAGAFDELRDAVKGEFAVATPAGTDPASGAYSISWLGETNRGNYKTGSPVRFSFPLPGAATWRAKGALVLELQSGEQKYRFERGLEVSRNIGLSQAVPMAREDQYKEGGGASRSDVTFRASANANGITFIHEIATPLRKLGGKAPYYLELQIDARPYGKRRHFGFADFVRFIPLEDGGVKVSSLRPALFGNGYAKKLDSSAIKTSRKLLPGGGETLTVTIPRRFFYLHEWALGNGNSLLGINSRVFVQGPSATDEEPYQPDGDYMLVHPRMTRFNTQSLGILELSTKPTKRWSSRLY
jgi:hypothetical protein